MNSSDGLQLSIQIITSALTIISLLTVFVRLGAWKGKQDQLNISQSEKNKEFHDGIEKNADSIKCVETSLSSEIKGVERRLSDRIDRVKDDLSTEIRKSKA